jgi:hypothetical protein
MTPDTDPPKTPDSQPSALRRSEARTNRCQTRCEAKLPKLIQKRARSPKPNRLRKTI